MQGGALDLVHCLLSTPRNRSSWRGLHSVASLLHPEINLLTGNDRVKIEEQVGSEKVWKENNKERVLWRKNDSLVLSYVY